MHVIRKFEETIRELYTQGKIRGSFHPCVGQEGVCRGGVRWSLAARRPAVVYLPRSRPRAGKRALRRARNGDWRNAWQSYRAARKVKGGSMHFTDTSVGLIGANAIVAAGIPHAAGAALARGCRRKTYHQHCLFGEERSTRESFTRPSEPESTVWNLPVITGMREQPLFGMTPSFETTSQVETWRRARHPTASLQERWMETMCWICMPR